MTDQYQGKTVNQFIVTVRGTDGTDYGAWDASDGGDYSPSTSTKKISGGKTIVLGGTVTVSDLTLTRQHRLATRDQWTALRAGSGKLSLLCTMQEVDENGAPWGDPQSFTGVLGDVLNLKYDENSTDGQTESITITIAS